MPVLPAEAPETQHQRWRRERPRRHFRRGNAMPARRRAALKGTVSRTAQCADATGVKSLPLAGDGLFLSGLDWRPADPSRSTIVTPANGGLNAGVGPQGWGAISDGRGGEVGPRG